MKTKRKNNGVFLSPLRVQRRQQVQRSMVCCFALYSIGVGIGAMISGALEMKSIGLYSYLCRAVIADEAALFSTVFAAVAAGVFKSAVVTLSGLCSIGSPVVLALQLGYGAVYGAIAGVVVRTYGGTGSVLALCALAVPEALSALILCRFSSSAIDMSMGLFTSQFKRKGDTPFAVAFLRNSVLCAACFSATGAIKAVLLAVLSPAIVA